MMSPWAYPENRYYYEWYDESPGDRSDSDIKQDLLDQIRTGPYADQYDIDADEVGDLFNGEQLGPVHEDHVFGHAVGVAQVAAVRDADAQVVVNPAKTVDQRTRHVCRLYRGVVGG